MKTVGAGRFLATVRPAGAAALSHGPWQSLRTPLLLNAFYLAVRFGVDAALGAAFWVVAARLYPAEDVGLAAAAISAMGLLATIAPLGLEASLIRFLPRAGDRRGSEQINAALAMAGALSLAAAAVFILGTPVWSPSLQYLRDQPFYFVAFSLFVLAWTLSTLLVGVYVGARRARYALTQGLVFGAGRLIALLPLAAVLRAHTILLGWGAGLGAALIAGLCLMRRLRPQHDFSLGVSRAVAGEMLGYSLPNHAANLAWLAPTWVLPLLVVNLLGPAENAYFYLPWTLAWSLGAIPAAVSLSLTAEGSFDETRLPHNLRQAALGLLLLLLPAVVVAAVAARQVLSIFGAEYAQNATPMFRLLVLAVVPSSLNYLYTAVRRVEKKLTGIVALTSFVGGATLGGSYFLMDGFGLIGVAYAWLGAQGIGGLFSAYHLWRKARDGKPTAPSATP